MTADRGDGAGRVDDSDRLGLQRFPAAPGLSAKMPGMSCESDSGPESAAARPRVRHVRRWVATALVGAAGFGLLVWVAPPATVLHQITHMRLGWVVAALALELGSCLSFLPLFHRFFPEPTRAVGRQVAWISMGAGAVLPGGSISTAATTGWLLRNQGVGAGRLFARCGALLCLLTLFGFFVNGVAGVLLLVGVPGGPHDLLHTGGPILVSVAVLGAAWLITVVTRRLGARAPAPLRGLAIGLDGAFSAVRHPHWRLLGAAGFLLLDMGALLTACYATGHTIGLEALAIGYCIGYLATAVPMPAGLGVLDSGLAASLVLYGMKPAAAAVSAVLVYHAIAIWVPGVGGLLAWLPTRRRRARVGAAPLVQPLVGPLPGVPLAPLPEPDA